MDPSKCQFVDGGAPRCPHQTGTWPPASSHLPSSIKPIRTGLRLVSYRRGSINWMEMVPSILRSVRVCGAVWSSSALCSVRPAPAWSNVQGSKRSYIPIFSLYFVIVLYYPIFWWKCSKNPILSYVLWMNINYYSPEKYSEIRSSLEVQVSAPVLSDLSTSSGNVFGPVDHVSFFCFGYHIFSYISL